MSSKRHSVLPAVDRSGPKPPVNFSTSLTISDNAVLLGIHSITMQAETVIHPRSRIESSVGSVLVGRRCIVQERVHIGAPPNDREKGSGGVSLGDYVLVEAGSVVEAGGTEIGEGSVIQVGSKIGSGAKIGKVRSSRLLIGLQRWKLTQLRTARCHTCPSLLMARSYLTIRLFTRTVHGEPTGAEPQSFGS